ncbi:UDP-2,4-diacetamido-2,4,6-trideoxy-beta-L-altropyranose hydrolase [Verrucomicrobiaceae bacterium 227]
MTPLLIRADAGGMTGTGHVMRMIALAQAYRRRGGDVTIATVNCPPLLAERVKTLGINHHPLDTETPGSPGDAQLTAALSGQLKTSWLVLDGYHFSYDYQRTFRDLSVKILCVDDHGYSPRWCCDALLNQNLDANLRTDWDNDLAHCQYLLGSSFCLLREEFLSTPADSPLESGTRLLVTLGGSDPENATGAVLNLLNKIDLPDLTIRILLGADCQQVDQLKATPSPHRLEFIINSTRMPEQLAWATHIISAGGSTCWEWLHARLPGAIVTIADNQVPIVTALTGPRKAALPLGWFHDLDSPKKSQAVHAWLLDPASCLDPCDAHSIVDGKGADRVAALFSPHPKVNIITAEGGWMKPHIEDFFRDQPEVQIFTKARDLPSGDILLILSCWEILNPKILQKHTHNLVIHESDLPKGKGWSPLTWQVLEGSKSIPITAFEAADQVDAGDIFLQGTIELEGHELIEEIRTVQAQASFALCQKFIEQFPAIITRKTRQSGESTFYERRSPKDSRLDPHKTLQDQFNLLRVVDNESYPAYFEHEGHTYLVKIEKTAPLS